MNPTEALNFIAQTTSSDWPERCQENVRVARAALAAPVTPAEPTESWVLVPKRMTQEMRDVTDSEGWTWEDLLAEAGSISQEEYAAIAAAPVVPASPITVEAVAEVRSGDAGLELDWLIEGGVCALCPGQVLVVATRPITDDDGAGEVYADPPDVQRDADQFTQAIQRLNSIPYALTKDECIQAIRELRDSAKAPT